MRTRAPRQSPESPATRALKAAALLSPLVLCMSCLAALTPARPDDSRRDNENFQDFMDVPFPSEMTLDKGMTLVYSRRDVQSGRISVAGPLSSDEMLDYFDRHLPPHGWTPRAEVRTQKTTVSTWSKGSKTLTVVAEELTLAVGARSRATIYVAPPHTQSDLGHRTIYQSTRREHGEQFSTTPIRQPSGGGGRGSGGVSEDDL